MEKDKLDDYIQELNSIVVNKLKDMKECDKELSKWEYSYIVRTALMNYKLDLQEEVDRYNHMLISALKESKGIA